MSKYLCLHSWGGTADSFEMAKLAKLSGEPFYPESTFDVPTEEFSNFLKQNGHPQEIIDMMKDFPHKTYIVLFL